jgi:hypothetical protein
MDSFKGRSEENMKEYVLMLVSKYQAAIDNEKEIRNPENMPNTYDRVRSIDRQWVYEKVVADLKELESQ